MTETSLTSIRIDKWLWAARFFKTRSLAVEAIGKGRIEVNGLAVKPSREVRVGDRVTVREPGRSAREMAVQALSAVRGPAPVAQTLYAETPESIAAREADRERHRMGVEPALALNQGRPTKRDRRVLQDWQRWSAVATDKD